MARRSLRLVLIMLGVMLVVEMKKMGCETRTKKLYNVHIANVNMKMTKREIRKLVNMYKEEAEYLI